jgi:ADP-heptose:LPS heptosyltransferase
MNATTVALGQPVAVRRVLAVRLDSLGDVLMCTPALQAMRKAWPDAHLTLLT